MLPEPVVKIRLLALVLGGTAFGASGAGCQKREAPQPPPTSHRAPPSPPGPSAPGQPPVTSVPSGPGGPAGPAQSPDELSAPLARIDDVTITLGELQERINRQSPYIRARYTSLEQKKEFLDSLIRLEVLAKEAARRGRPSRAGGRRRQRLGERERTVDEMPRRVRAFVTLRK